MTEKGVEMTEKGLEMTEKGLEMTEKGLEMTRKRLSFRPEGEILRIQVFVKSKISRYARNDREGTCLS
jgi:hypothetical protein